MQNPQLSELEMQRRGRKIFLLMLTFFVVPIIVVVLMFKFNWKPTGASLGELVKPARLLDTQVALQDSEGKVLTPAAFWKEKWSVVYVAEQCDKACMDKLHDMRQLHVSLYKDIARTQRVFLTAQQDVTDIKSKYPDLLVINQPGADVLSFAQQFNIGNEQAASGQRLYLVDPLGHLMMSYTPQTPLAHVRKDITRLLKYSWAG